MIKKSHRARGFGDIKLKHDEAKMAYADIMEYLIEKYEI